MGAIIRRTIPISLALFGIASYVYGVMFHAAPVFEEQEIEISLDGPEGFQAPFGQPGGFPELPPFLEPPPFMRKVKEKVLVKQEMPEPVLVRDATVGGVIRLASGELKRTYSGKAPSLCPT